MNALFWNVTKGRMVREVIRAAHVDIVHLEETKICKPNPIFYRQLNNNCISTWVVKNAKGSSGGILMGFNGSICTVLESWEGCFSLLIILRWARDNWEQVVTTIYGPNKRRLRPQFWNELRSIKKQVGTTLDPGGNFNIVRFQEERRGGDGNGQDREMFNTCRTEPWLTYQ